MSWLDDLMAQIAQNGADAVPSDPATDSVFSPARDSQSANSLFGSLFSGGDPSVDMPPMPEQPPADNNPASAADYRNGADMASDAYRPPAGGGVLQALTQKMGLKRAASGDIDYSDPKTLDAIVKLVLGGGALMNSLTHQNAPLGYKTAAQLQAEIKNPLSSWNPTQQASSDAFFNTPINNGPTRPRIYASDMRSPIVPGKGYALGGAVRQPPAYAAPAGHAPYGALGHVMASGGGQDDDVDAKLSGGEYVMDADTVSNVGDGNNAAGAKRLDGWREELRRQKRSAPVGKIPPKTRELSSYMKGGR